MNIELSKGHITFATAYDGRQVEFYADDNDLIYMAPIHNAIDVCTGYRHGRYECHKRQWALVAEVWDVPEDLIHPVVMSTFE